MNSATAVKRLSALAHRTRLDVVRELSGAPEGLQASVLAERLKIQRSALSNHLKTLATAGLIKGKSSGRTITYRIVGAAVAQVGELLAGWAAE